MRVRMCSSWHSRLGRKESRHPGIHNPARIAAPCCGSMQLRGATVAHGEERKDTIALAKGSPRTTSTKIKAAFMVEGVHLRHLHTARTASVKPATRAKSNPVTAVAELGHRNGDISSPSRANWIYTEHISLIQRFTAPEILRGSCIRLGCFGFWGHAGRCVKGKILPRTSCLAASSSSYAPAEGPARTGCGFVFKWPAG